MTSIIGFWKSEIMLKYPWAQPMFFAAAAVVLSFFTWFRKPRHNQSKESESDSEE
ncbi:hypothetical protein [Paenibacillus pinisoli]|uniref:hypothetical protein n=1 Tax=Paenibacillus pinisoli TaxID=1276110 RepID=UPI001401C0C6|nr:hypothetical protein [Paenibacillus pinisoli]